MSNKTNSKSKFFSSSILYCSIVALCFILAAGLTSCSANHQDLTDEDGIVTYSYENGTIQCLSQKDPQGSTVILVQSLTENTTITDIDFGWLGDDLAIRLLMIVKKNKSSFAGWMDMQEVIVPIYPLAVPKITLQGKPIITEGKVVVLIPFDAEEGFEQIFE